MAEVLVLDMAVLLIPLSVVMVLIRVLHFFVFVQFRFSESHNSKTVKEGQVVVRASNLRVSATFSPAKSFQANEDQSLASCSWCHLPEDLVIDQILSRLPVKSLIRFKSVCKRWHALLKTPSFIASHLKYIDTPNRLVSWNGNNNSLIVEHDGFHVFTESCHTPNFQPVNLKFGFDRKPDLVLGPCDGIFCLYWRANSNFSYHSGDYQVGVNVERLPTIALWNPATRAFSILPMSKFDFPPYRRVTHCMVGFGFDLTAKSIKVVKISSFSNAEGLLSDFINCAEVYDLSSGSWRVLHLDDMFQEVCVEDEVIVSMYNNNDGLFHWHTGRHCFSSPWYPDGDAVVLSFDMSTELFHVTPLPEKYNDYQLSSMSWRECSFALLGDSLALICSFIASWFSQSYVSIEGHTTVEVWVMKDFDCMFEAGERLSSYSWCHELTLEPPLPGSCVSTGFSNKNELLIWKDFDHYHYPRLRSARSPFLYDIVTKQARDVEISGELNFVYRESLVSVEGGCGNE